MTDRRIECPAFHQHVDWRVRGEQRPNDASNFELVCEIACKHVGRPALVGDLAAQLLEPTLIAREQQHDRPGAGELREAARPIPEEAPLIRMVRPTAASSSDGAVSKRATREGVYGDM